MGAVPHPGARPGGQRKRRVFDAEVRIGPIDFGRRRQDFVTKRHDDFEQAGGAGSGLRVADLRFYGTQVAPGLALATGLFEDHLQPGEFGGIPSLRARAVGLDQLDGLRAIAGMVVRPAQRFGLPLGDRRVDALRSAVRRRTDARDDRVDAVARRFGVLEALERDHAQTLAEHRPVGAIRERPAVAGRRQRRRLAEAHEHEDVVHRVHAAGDHEIRLAQIQLVHGHRQRGERRCTRRVRDAVRTAEVQPICNASCNDVAEDTGERTLLPRLVVARDPFANLVDFTLAESVLAQRFDPHRSLEASDHGRQQFLRGRHTEDDRRSFAVFVGELTAGRIVEDLLRDDQREQLCGVGRRYDVRRYAPPHRVEVDVAEERAALGVGLVRRLRVGVVIVFDQPVRRRHVADQVLAAEDVPPEAGRVRRAWEQGAGANDGDRGSGRAIAFGHHNLDARRQFNLRGR